MAERPYSRVYWSIMEDQKFDGVREDLRLFGAWALLLVVADMAWPSPAFVPPMVPKTAVARLASADLVDVLDGHRYRIHGLDKEREMRQEWGRSGAALRWHSNGTGDPLQDRAETKKRREEQRRAETRLPTPSRAGARERLRPDDEPIGPDEERAVLKETLKQRLGAKS